MTYRPMLEQKIMNLKENHPEKYQKLQKEIENKLYGFDPSLYQQAKEAVTEKVEEVKNIPIREYRKWKEIGGNEK
jgi:Skp family chaperone for outer membrane proteins